jgi:hypothetical protein
MKKSFLTILILFAACAFNFAQTNASEIKISSRWGGLGQPQKSELVITRKSKDFYSDGEKIDAALVENLLKAINAPQIEKFELANLGITQEWLDANAEAGVKEYADVYFSMGAPNQKALYLNSFKNLKFIEKILPDALRGGWTDDYPYFEIQITEEGGGKTVVSSDNQPTFMLPWKISKGGKEFETFNADIPRAIVALLPKKFANRERLNGEYFRRVLAERVMREIQEDWEYLEVENKAADALKTLKETYTIVAAELNPYHGLDFGDEWGKGKTPEKNLHLVLRKNDFPEGFSVRLKLLYQNEKAQNPDVFLNKIDKYQDLVFSVDWLKKLLPNKRSAVELRFIQMRSFSEKAMKRFAEDMNKIGKTALVAEVEKEKENIALIGVGGGLEYYQSYWLVLPDKRVILWRYRYARLLNWSEKDFEAKECTDEISAGLKCVGAIISPDGNIISK